MKRTKSPKRSKSKKSKLPSVWVVAAALTVALILNRLYLRYRVIPIAHTIPPSIMDQSSEVSEPPVATPIYPYMHIERLGVTLPIYPATVVGGKWETTAKGLSHASNSAHIGSSGNTVIYGHNWPNMLKRLPDLKPGDLLTISLSESEIITYTVTYAATVTPDDISLTRSTTDSRLTLYTCIGLLDRDRYVVVAHLN
ncbi:MAG: hypothetical protein Fur0011_6450 [Candidatus Microgenomates bacterium]